MSTLLRVQMLTSTTAINVYNKSVTYNMNYYILHTFLLVIILLFIIAMIFYHYITI